MTTNIPSRQVPNAATKEQFHCDASLTQTCKSERKRLTVTVVTELRTQSQPTISHPRESVSSIPTN